MRLQRGFGPNVCGSICSVELCTYDLSFFPCSIYPLQSSNTALSCGIFSFYFLLSANRTPNFVCTSWQYGFWSFQKWGIELERFLPKNQHTQRKLWNYENWCSVELSKIGHHFSNKVIEKLILMIFDIKN